MKKALFLFTFLAIIFFNCGEDVAEKKLDSRSHCEIALDYISECIGAKVPEIKSCDEGVAIEIVNTPCSELKKVIFDL